MSSPQRRYYVIEIRHRGTLMEWRHDHNGRWRPRFSWKGLRSDPGVERFYHLTRAREELKKVLPVAAGAYIIRMGGGPRSGEIVMADDIE